ncbi:MAG: flagellar hook-associated protein FlgK, partial [Thiohalophilus sp.]|uniref:flagellar hook-associated protein FlgK n=1 Tax=Thiohalophilus sp. TaxID=3028392 RepID=UPI0028702D07
MASGDLLGVSVSGALAAQRALSTTGHNIANANTEGYSRQRVDLGTRPPQLAGNGAIGTGVTVNNVERVYDDFVAGEVRTNTSADSSLRANYEYTSQVDNLLSDPNAGLAPALQSFFSAVNGVSADPSSTSARQVMLSEAQSLSDRFQYMHDRFDTLREGATAEMKSVVTDINDLATSIGKINDSIINAQEMSGQPPSDLLDQRDRMVQKLSELVSVRVSEQDDGRLNVFIGNGQTLVVGSEVSEMAIEKSRFDPNHAEIVFKGNASDSVITKFISGGRLGGILEFRNGVLDPAQNELGRIAVGITKTFNEQHRLGMDLESKLGDNFFTQAEELAPNILPNGRNQGDYKISA